MNLTVNGTKPKAITCNGSKVKAVTVNGVTVWRSEVYIVGADGNNTAKAGASLYASDWYYNTLRCNYCWSVDATGYAKINIDVLNQYIRYHPDGENEIWVNSTCNIGYSATSKTVGIDYNKNTFAKYVDCTKDNVRSTYTIDISQVTGTIYIWLGLCAAGGGITASALVYNLWLS